MPTARPICSWMRARARRSWCKHLGNAVRLREPAEFVGALDALKGKTVLADPTTAAAAIFDRLAKAGAKVKRGVDPCQLPKACKNPVEIEGARKAHIRDGAALTKFLAWFAREAPNGQLTEIEVGASARRLSPADRFADGSELRFDFGCGPARGAPALSRVAFERPAHQQERDLPDRFRRPISRRHDGRDAHDDRRRSRRPKCAIVSRAC